MTLRLQSMTRWRNVMLAVLLCAAAPCSAIEHVNEYDGALREEVVRIPLPSEAHWPALIATTYRPQGNGPFPLIVLNHGSPASVAEREKMGRYRVLDRVQEFVIRGYAVVVPMRTLTIGKGEHLGGGDYIAIDSERLMWQANTQAALT